MGRCLDSHTVSFSEDSSRSAAFPIGIEDTLPFRLNSEREEIGFPPHGHSGVDGAVPVQERRKCQDLIYAVRSCRHQPLRD